MQSKNPCYWRALREREGERFRQGCFDFACSVAATEETALSKTLVRREFDRKDMKDVKHFQP
jgi:hypothetical protein